MPFFQVPESLVSSFSVLFVAMKFVEYASHLQFYHTKESLTKYACIHLARSKHSVHEDNRHFLNLKSKLISREFHLYLECVALKFHLVETDCCKHTAVVAHKSGSGVAHTHTSDYSHISRCIIRHQHSAHWPIHHVHA